MPPEEDPNLKRKVVEEQEEEDWSHPFCIIIQYT